MSKKSFVRGAAVLAVAGIICKFIGMFYRIPMTQILGNYGMGVYQHATPIYAILLGLSSSGIPTAIAFLVAEHLTKDDERGAWRVFRISFHLLFWIGVITTVLLVVFRNTIATIYKDPDVVLSLITLAPSLFFVSLISAYRGYFQGRQHMAPTAISQLVEQVVKLGMGMVLATAWQTKGVEYGVAGAFVGVTLSEVVALLYLMLVQARQRHSIIRELAKPMPRRGQESTRSIAIRLAKLAIPATVASVIMPLVTMIDGGIVANRLVNLLGYSAEQATTLNGLMGNKVNVLVNIPAVVTTSLSMSLVPAISAYRAQGNIKGIRRNAIQGVRLAMIISLPVAMGFFVLAEPIMLLLFGASDPVMDQTAANLLKIMSLGTIFLALLHTMTGFLQGLGRVRVPLRNLLMGGIVKVILSFILIGIPQINILGAAISSTACYGVAGLLNVYAVKSATRTRFRLKRVLLRPLLASAGMGLVVWLCHKLLVGSLGNAVATSAAICVGIVAYVFLLLVTGGVNRRDLKAMPGGGKLARVLEKTHLLRKE